MRPLRFLWLTLFLCSMNLMMGQSYSKSGWHIVADDIDANNYYGVTLANGMIGMVSGAAPMSVKDVVLNGAFDTYGRGRVSNILKGFNFADIELVIDGTFVEQSSISNYRQVLDMKNAELITTFEVDGKASVTHKIRALRHLPFTGMIDIEIKMLKDGEIMVAHNMEAPDILRDVQNSYQVINRPHVKIPLMTSIANSPTGKHKVAASCSYIFDNGNHHLPENFNHEEWDYARHLMRLNKELKKGETYSFSIVGSVISTEHTPDPLNEAERLSIYAMLEGKDRLINRHQSAWEELWASDIVIEDNVAEQRAVHSAIYHLYSFARKGTAYSLSPMGLSGLGYNGHVFWDTEIWMFPPLLMLQPDIAKSLLEYRFERMDAARQNAFSHGYDGVMFPWESDDAGQESTPVWALTGPFQHHITGDVGWAYWKYYQVTQDKEWLKTRGYPMLKEVADFWVSRAELGDDGKYHIINVVAADEYAENVDDNAYTNGMAKQVLGYAIEAAEALDITPNPSWKEVGEGIVILKFEDGVTREHATYDGELIKQADVNLLSYPMTIVTDEEAIKKDLAYYEPRMDKNGPAMGRAILSILYNQFGETEKAHDLFVKSYQPNEVPPFGVIAETPGGTNPYFATGAGGMLQAVLVGFGGLEITNDGIRQNDSELPKAWSGLILKGIGKDKKTYRVVQ